MIIDQKFLKYFEVSDVSFDIDDLVDIIEFLEMKPGSLVVDPYAGMGLAGIVAGAYGYDSVSVEIDRDNFDRLSKNFQKAPNCHNTSSLILNADSNTVDWSEHLQPDSVQSIITSPPFTIGEHNTDPSINFEETNAYRIYVERIVENFLRLKIFLMPDALIVVDIGDDISKEGEVRGLIKDYFIELMGRNGFNVEKRKKGKNIELNEEYIFFRVSKTES